MSFFGTPLPPNETEDDKKRIERKKMIATDENGKRRFHGAFTGGFSAGHFNTVGTKEGWVPSSFVSSRKSRTDHIKAAPEHYMDKEDFRESGAIALSTSHKYTSNRGNKSQFGSTIYDSCLESLLTVREQPIGEKFLRMMQHDIESSSNEILTKKVYSCPLPPELNKNVLFNPESCIILPKFENLVHKSDFRGVGYTGLSSMRNDTGGFSSSALFSNDRTGITGQAFGVGIFEDEDEDIYKTESANKYHSLFGEKSTLPKDKISIGVDATFILTETDNFENRRNCYFEKNYPEPDVPNGYAIFYNPLEDDKLLNELDIKFEIPHIEKPKICNEPKTTIPCPKNTKTTPEGPLYKGCIKLTNLRSFVKPSQEIEAIVEATAKQKRAASQKNYGELTRVISHWIPNSLLYSRFNIKLESTKRKRKMEGDFQDFGDEFAGVKKKFFDM